MQLHVDRRAVLAGAAALACAPHAARAAPTIGEAQIRANLVRLLDRSQQFALSGIPVARTVKPQLVPKLVEDVEIDIARLAEFDRGTGAWRTLASAFREGVTDVQMAERLMRERLARTIDESMAEFQANDCERMRRRMHQAWEDKAEFERREGRLRQIVDRYPLDV